MAYDKISELTPSKDDWVVQVRLCRMWEAVNFKNNNDVMGLDMVFVDDTGESIQVFIRKNHIKKYKPIFEEGDVYAIKNFKVIKSSMEYKVVPNEYRIYFNMMTTVRKLTNVSHQIPSNVFFFTHDETHEERVSNNSLLTDIIGCVVGVGEVQHIDNFRKTMKRDIQLASKSGANKVMKVTLWGKTLEMFDLSSYENVTTPLIAVVTSTTIKKFQGELKYGSTTATRIYLNPDIHEAKVISSRFVEGKHNIEALETQDIQQLPLAEQMVLNRKTISEIVEMAWISDNQECVFTVLASIVGIDHGYGWCYVSCNQCSKKLVPSNGSFLCNTCNKQCCYPIIRYKIHVNVSDPSGNTTFVIFNQEAEKLLDSSANKFVNRLGIGNNHFPEEITNLTGKSFVFKIKLTDYNLKDGFENYTVVKIFEVDEIPKNRFCGLSYNKGVEIEKACNSTMAFAVQPDDLPNKLFTSVETGGSTCDGESLLELPTPEKESFQRKKLKSKK